MGGELAAPVIVLAAGRGERVGRPKGLVRVQGVPWLERQIERLADCGARRVVVVLGHAYEEHARAMAWVEAARAARVPLLGTEVEVARNDQPELGPFSSLACALARIDPSDDAFVLPVDVPCPGAQLWSALAHARVLAAVPTRAGRGGHPVLLAAALVACLRALPLDARLDVQLRALGEGEVARVPTDDVRAFTNLNTREDWESVGGGEADDR